MPAASSVLFIRTINFATQCSGEFSAYLVSSEESFRGPHCLVLCYWPHIITYTLFDGMKMILEGLGNFMDDNVDIYFTIISAIGIWFSPRKET